MSNAKTHWILLIALCLAALSAPSCKKKSPPKREIKAGAYQVNNAAFRDGAVWFVETQGKMDEDGKGSAASRLVRLQAGANQKIERVAPLDDVEPWLLAGKDRLWILSANSVATYQDGKLATEKLPEPLRNVSRPFLYHGKPALIASEPPGYRLMQLKDGKWKPHQKLRMRLPNESDECTGEYLHAFEHDGVIHVFCQVPLAAPVYYHRGLPLAEGPQQWEKVADAPGQWKPACLGGNPSLFFHADRNGPVVIGLILRDGEWKEFFSRAVGLDIGLGVCPTGKGENFVLLRRILPLGIKIIGVENAEPVWVHEGEGKTNLLEALVNSN